MIAECTVQAADELPSWAAWSVFGMVALTAVCLITFSLMMWRQ